jgi:hypothetical protein
VLSTNCSIFFFFSFGFKVLYFEILYYHECISNCGWTNNVVYLLSDITLESLDCLSKYKLRIQIGFIVTPDDGIIYRNIYIVILNIVNESSISVYSDSPYSTVRYHKNPCVLPVVSFL